MQGLEERYKDLHRRLDVILERIVKEHEKQRKVWREMGVGGDCAKDLIDILLDISKDENADEANEKQHQDLCSGSPLDS